MNIYRLTIFFLTLWFCYSSHVLAEETANEIVVLTKSDQVNGDISSIAALKANPGPDGISLREAIYAGNTTKEQKNIIFSEDLNGETIFVYVKDLTGSIVLPSLTSGYFRINGDIDGDGKPDITLNGKKIEPHSAKSLSSDDIPYNPTRFLSGFNINSSNVTIESLIIKNFPSSGISISALHDFGQASAKISNIAVKGCIISRCSASGVTITHPAYGSLEFDEMSNLSWSNIKVINNIISDIVEGSGIAVYLYGTNNTARKIRIQGNTVDNCIHGIALCAADVSTYYHDPLFKPIRYSDNNSIIDVKILNNMIKNSGWSFCISCSNFDNRNNSIRKIEIKNNTMDGGTNGVDGITINVCGNFGEVRTMQNNVIDNIKVIENKIRNQSRWGVRIENGILPKKGYKGKPFFKNILKNVVFKKNLIERYESAGFYIVLARSGSYNQIKDLMIEQNTIIGPLFYEPGNNAPGMICYVGIANVKKQGCLDGVNAKNNEIKLLVLRQNHFQENQTAIHFIGGWGVGANNNRMTGSMQDNIFTSNIEELIIQENVKGGKGNIIKVNESH